MNYFETQIHAKTVGFFNHHIKALSDYKQANSIVKQICGINNFFINQEDALGLIKALNKYQFMVAEPGRREYGDFQTNEQLTLEVVKYIASKEPRFEFIFEPTCGKGNFIISSIKQFQHLKKIVGIEIYQPYVWEAKFNILNYYLSNPAVQKPEIDIIHTNTFEFPYDKLGRNTKTLKTLIIGNPPWVTNSELGSVSSKNLPKKINLKGYSGIEAITGKGNFDIGEYISLMLLNAFQEHNGIFAFLIKNSVIRNIIHGQKKNQYHFSGSESLIIDAKKEFGASVKASLFVSQLNTNPGLICHELDFYTKKQGTTFGWFNNKFVSSVNGHNNVIDIDGKSGLIWRSGIKHDCSKVMEFTRYNEHYLNGMKQVMQLEEGLIYGLLKSSDLKNKKVSTYRKLTIITQKRIGQETTYIEKLYPLTHKYLTSHKGLFAKRKSSIYKNKPKFSIFGIGDYSFKQFKVAISGLYKSTIFTLVVPEENNKPIMLDDTCYFIGFDSLKNAEIAHYIVNSDTVQQFLKSIIFIDSKRPVTKEILMRLDIEKAYRAISFKTAKIELKGISLRDWQDFGELFKEEGNHKQMKLFQTQ